ncbi:MAG: mechanosensitive ion channel family protein [Magnetococcales bacterium]|nr:mechanosensitive ion channel family protein [Magnetococcales bacterium]
MNKTDILFDIGIMLAILLIAEMVSNIFPGKVKSDEIKKGNIQIVEKKRNLQRVVKTIYIFCLTLFVHVDFLLLEGLGLDVFSKKIIQIEGQLSEFWLLFWASALLINTIEYGVRHSAHLRGNPVPNLLFTILRWLAMVAAGIAIGQTVFAWHPASLLASGAMFSVVLSMALKSTLSDLLAGISLNMVHSVVPSQWIMLPSSQFPDGVLAGEVIATNWRETRIRSTAGHVYVVANSKLAAASMHNMSWPNPVRRHAIHFYISNQYHPDQVIEALLATTVDNPKILHDPKAPEVLIANYLELSIQFTLRFWSETFYDKAGLESGLRRKAWDELAKRDIKLPIVSHVQYHQEAPHS